MANSHGVRAARRKPRRRLDARSNKLHSAVVPGLSSSTRHQYYHLLPPPFLSGYSFSVMHCRCAALYLLFFLHNSTLPEAVLASFARCPGISPCFCFSLSTSLSRIICINGYIVPTRMILLRRLSTAAQRNHVPIHRDYFEPRQSHGWNSCQYGPVTAKFQRCVYLRDSYAVSIADPRS